MSAFLLALALLGVTLLFFAPHLWVMRHEVPGSFEWARADGFLKQCEDPFRRDIEPALHWRLLPPLVCHVLGLSGRGALVMPFIGIVAMLTLAVRELSSRLPSRGLAALAALPLATSSATLSSLHFFGINDAWVWTGLIAVAFSRTTVALPLSCLLGPWVDERFVIGFPLAIIVRCLDREQAPQLRCLLPGLWLVPYFVTRLGFVADASTQHFLTAAIRESADYLAFAPLGWWMALRFGWVPVVAGVWLMPSQWRWPAIVVAFVTLVSLTLLASDLSRSAAVMVLPMLWGTTKLVARYPAFGRQILLVLGSACLVVPVAHVVYTKINLVRPLPLELFLLWRMW